MEDDYEEFRRCARAAGGSDEDIEHAIAEMRAVDASLQKGECPKCCSAVTKRLDPRQAGPSHHAGLWFNYRCPSCGFAVDFKEPVGEN